VKLGPEDERAVMIQFEKQAVFVEGPIDNVADAWSQGLLDSQPFEATATNGGKIWIDSVSIKYMREVNRSDD
jgi:hypothetical protein